MPGEKSVTQSKHKRLQRKIKLTKRLKTKINRSRVSFRTTLPNSVTKQKKN